MNKSPLSYLSPSPLAVKTIALWLFLVVAQCAYADTPDAETDAELDYRITRFYQDYYLNDDFTSSLDSHIAVKVLTEKSIENLKTTSISYSTSIEKVDVLDAYTLKADGKKLVVPKDNFQLKINKGNKDGGPVYSDRTSLTIVFPDVAVNDTVYFSYKTTQTEPMFPKHFTAQGLFSRQSAYDDAKVTINVPAALDFKHQVREMDENISQKGNRKIITLTFKNPKPKKNERKDYSVWDMESVPGFALSTFKDYESIAAAYGERASPKAAPTDRVKKLAKDIIGKTRDRKEKTKLLYNWVATNITYAGNCIGVGAVVPHDTDFILDNKMGDCKDHATLLQALLTAEEIPSTQALINSGSSYQLPTIPMVSSVNHVINYLPEFNLFVDSTSQTTPFTMLPFSIAGKPVLLVDNFQAGMKTPVQKAGENKQVMDTVLHIQPDGSVKGTISMKLSGVPAVSARSGWRDVTTEQEKNWIESVFGNQGVKGIGSITKEDPEPLENSFNYSIEFEKKGFIQSAGAGAFYISPLISTPASIYAFADYPNEPFTHPSTCSNGTSIETYTYHFPDNIKVLAVPDNFDINAHHLHFKATYELDKNILKVSKSMEDTTPGNVCAPEVLNPQRELLIKVAENLSSQVVYKK
jgi:hypothetical protein